MFLIFPSLKCAKVDSMGPSSKPQILETLGENSTTIKIVRREFKFIAASLKDISFNYWLG